MANVVVIGIVIAIVRIVIVAIVIATFTVAGNVLCDVDGVRSFERSTKYLPDENIAQS